MVRNLLRVAAVLYVVLEFLTPDQGLLFHASAQAATDCTGTYGGACTITNSSAVAVVIPTQAVYLSIDNESTTATIACAFGNGSAAINTAGSYTVPAGATRVWDFGPRQNILPSGNLNCISSAATSPATIDVH